ncbi:hypothetical protein IEO21_09673 [Rhodonia placenta]|uniref:Uncharacterized protein n=1 Tax=Rhodonia placenta TaxID=104341 RepID=A0A8H7NTY4_9APHY|nr:hypothetical protein IEO21_09673 [Postia placenta]
MTSRVAYATAMPRYLSEVTLSNSARAQRSKVAQYYAANDDRQIRPSELLAPERDRFLHSLTHSLTSLTLARRPDILTLLEPHTVWPCVRRLSVWGNVGSLAALAAAFPALVYLHVPTLDLDVVDTLRPAVWPALDHVVTGCPLLLACPVRRLELHYDLDAIDEAAWYAGTLALLRDTAPVVLACSMNSRVLACIANAVPSVRLAEFLVTDFLLEALLGGDAESTESCIVSQSGCERRMSH